MKYTQIPTTAFQNIQLNAGILLDSFNPSTGVVGNIIGATSGGVSFADTPEYVDFGDDIDNCPKNMLELKKIDSRDIKLSGTFITVSAATIKMLIATADSDALDNTHIIPRDELKSTDFKDIWWVGDYSDKNTGADAGFCAIHLMNALNTAGFQIQSADKGKGQFAFEFTAHYSMDTQDVVPYEVYIQQGGTEPIPAVLLDKHAITLAEGDNATLVATTIPTGSSVTWSSNSSSVASVSGGIVTAEGVGNAIITASITVGGVSYTDTCTVVVTE